MKTASVAAIKAHLDDFLKEGQQGPIIVTKNGKPVAALVAVADDDELERLMLANSPKFRAVMEKSRRQIEETGGIPHDRFWQEVEAENRAQPKTARPNKRKGRRA